MKKLFLVLLILSTLATKSFAQNKMIVGQKHTILVEMPKGWVQVHNDQLPFFIKPDQSKVSSSTYLYVYGIDYPISPDINGWIKGNNEAVRQNNSRTKIDTLNLVFNNFKNVDYLTGRYKTLNYQYTNGREEALLVIECKNTIATAVLSASTHAEFDKLLPAFLATAGTIQVLGSTLKK